MTPPPEINEVLAYFMTEYATDSSPGLLEDVVRSLLERSLRPEKAEEFAKSFLNLIQGTLVDEYNERYGKDCTLRFQLLDDEGSKIAGIGDLAIKERVAFQDALNALTHAQFEGLSALVLQEAGCDFLRRTPESHDQGIDSFGYLHFFPKRFREKTVATSRVVFLAQAKHYSQCRVGTKDIREFVGSFSLALHNIYSTVDRRYSELEMQPFSAVKLIFVTSEETPSTVKRLASRSGIVVLSSDDLFELFFCALSVKPAVITTDWFLSQWISEMEKIPVAK